MRRKANSFTKKVLYHLKKWNGQPVDLYLRGTASQDVETGVVTYPETKHHIKKAPVLNIDTMKMDNLAQNFAVAGRPFEYGGNYVINGTHVIVSQRDLPDNYTLNKNDAFIINHRRFSIKDTQEFQEAQAVIFILEELRGQPVNEIFNVKNEVILTQGVTSE